MASGGGLPITLTANDSAEQTAMEQNQSKQIFFEFILHGVVLNVLGLIGLIGNLLCIIILRRPQMRHNSTNVILATLATFDFMLIITSILMLGLPAVYQYTQDANFAYYYWNVFPYVTPWVYAIGMIAQTGSIYCTLGVTVERYIFVCWPLQASNICTYGRAKIGIVLIVLFSILYNIPRFFEISWDVQMQMNNQTKPEVVMTSLRRDHVYISVYITWMYLVFMYVLPFGGLSILNLLMFLDVRRSNARQSTLSANEKKELRLAVMLMVVVVAFLVCNILPLIVNILEVLAVEVKPLTQTSNLLVTLNSSINIFIYIIFGEKFQKQLLQCVGGICCLSGCRRSHHPAGHADGFISDGMALLTTPIRRGNDFMLQSNPAGCSQRSSRSLSPGNMLMTSSLRSASNESDQQQAVNMVASLHSTSRWSNACVKWARRLRPHSTDGRSASVAAPVVAGGDNDSLMRTVCLNNDDLRGVQCHTILVTSATPFRNGGLPHPDNPSLQVQCPETHGDDDLDDGDGDEDDDDDDDDDGATESSGFLMKLCKSRKEAAQSVT